MTLSKIPEARHLSLAISTKVLELNGLQFFFGKRLLPDRAGITAILFVKNSNF